MARIEDLLGDISNVELRGKIADEIAALKAAKSFGLVFERHIPETVVVGYAELRIGDLVRRRESAASDETFVVTDLDQRTATLLPVEGGVELVLPRRELLAVKPFGEPIYPALTPIGVVERSTDRPFHTVINGENFHTLQVLQYLYARQVDCIYIDPPYNTGATDWRYNNRFVDENDRYRHSKWLAMMERRLRLGAKLLKPDGVLICTIDENELHHLGMLLEEIFPAARRQIVTICINPSGASGGTELSRVEEYAIFCFLGDAKPSPTIDDMLTGSPATNREADPGSSITWESLLRRGNAWYRKSRPNLCYPVLLNDDGTRIVGVGVPFEGEDEAMRPMTVAGRPAAWPVRKDGKLGIWRVDGSRLKTLAERGYAYVSARDDQRQTWTVKYLMTGTIEAIDAGLVEILGRGDRDEVVGRVTERLGRTAKTMWYRGRHTAGGAGGTLLLNALLGERNLFPFPKSIYAVRDALEVAVGNRQNALVLDFFAGSGTTLHATCLLNADDSGARRCILVTNNEVNPENARRLNKSGHWRGDAEFERNGIFEAVTRPRCEAATTGLRPDGRPVEGSYLDGRSCSDGFEENVQFFRLDYLDPDAVEIGDRFRAIHPMLWLAAGSRGTQRTDVDPSKDFYVSENGGYAVLFSDAALRDFEHALEGRDDVRVAFIVTDSEEAYVDARDRIGYGRRCSMVYRDYLRSFRINTSHSL